MKKPTVWTLALLSLGISTGCGNMQRSKGPEITTPYAAVLLDNGQLYYGKLTNAGSKFPELTDIYYIQSQVNQETKAMTNILIRRGNEWHGEDVRLAQAKDVVEEALERARGGIWP